MPDTLESLWGEGDNSLVCVCLCVCVCVGGGGRRCLEAGIQKNCRVCHRR